jgi:hypothetical protein
MDKMIGLLDDLSNQVTSTAILKDGGGGGSGVVTDSARDSTIRKTGVVNKFIIHLLLSQSSFLCSVSRRDNCCDDHLI